MSDLFRDRTAIVGIGHSPCYKTPTISPYLNTVRTLKQAIEDAGLKTSDIDGVAGLGEPTPLAMIQALGLPGVTWYGGGLGGGVGPGIVASAALAVAAGFCTTAIAYRALAARRTSGPYNYFGADKAGGGASFTEPYGHGQFPQYFAAWYQRRQKVFGVTAEQMGAYVVAMRDNATRNPLAALGKPTTMEEYLASPFVAEPLRRFDCDLPVDVCGAVVVTTAERAKDMRHPPVYISAASTGTGPRPHMAFWHDFDVSSSHWAAKTIWNAAGMGPQDMDFGMIYDGFAPLVLYNLEEYGFVPKGEAGRWLGDGEHLKNGSLPLNPHGGNNSEGRSHAIGHMVEAAAQLRGQAGPRQLPKADVTFVNGGAIMNAGAVVLHN